MLSAGPTIVAGVLDDAAVELDAARRRSSAPRRGARRGRRARCAWRCVRLSPPVSGLFFSCRRRHSCAGLLSQRSREASDAPRRSQLHGPCAQRGGSGRRARRDSGRRRCRARRRGRRGRPATARASFPTSRRMRKCWRSAPPRSALGTRAAFGMRSLRDARALHLMRGGHFLRAHSPALLRRGRPQGRRGRARRPLLCRAHLPPCARGLLRYRRDARPRSLLRRFFRALR